MHRIDLTKPMPIPMISGWEPGQPRLPPNAQTNQYDNLKFDKFGNKITTQNNNSNPAEKIYRPVCSVREWNDLVNEPLSYSIYLKNMAHSVSRHLDGRTDCVAGEQTYWKNG